MEQDSFSPRVIALLGFGEAGSALGRGLCGDGGWRSAQRPGDNEPRHVIAIDTALDRDPRGAALGAAARNLDIAIARGYGEALREADLVFSAVPGENAREAAAAAAPLLKKGAIYLDLCTVTTRMAEEDRAEIEAGLGTYLDVAVMGSYHAHGHRAPLLLAGAAAAQLSPWLNGIGFQTTVLGTRPGSASGVKILRSVLLKGMEALGVECFVAARREGLLEEVLACLGDIDKVPFRDFMANLVATHVVHAHRRWEEMGLVARTLNEIGVPPLMTDSTERSLRRSVEAHIAPADGRVPPFDQAITILSEMLASPASGMKPENGLRPSSQDVVR